MILWILLVAAALAVILMTRTGVEGFANLIGFTSLTDAFASATTPGATTPGATTPGTNKTNGDWKPAYATYYWSYPACCKNAPNYDPKAPKDECSDYSGCKYMGQFTGSKKLSYEEVKARNIVAYFDDANQAKEKSKQTWWNKNIKGKKLEIRNPKTGKTLVVEALDTCGNYDCNNCCSKNAKKGGGVLIDLEASGAGARFWDGKLQNGKIEYRFL